MAKKWRSPFWPLTVRDWVPPGPIVTEADREAARFDKEVEANGGNCLRGCHWHEAGRPIWCYGPGTATGCPHKVERVDRVRRFYR